MVAKKPKGPAKGVYRPPGHVDRSVAPPPAPPAPDPGPGGPPVDPYLEARKAAAQRTLQIGHAQDQYQFGRIENQFGFGSDMSNPYSQAKLLEESYKRSRQGSVTSYAAQGQLYSGALQRKTEDDYRNYNIGVDQARRSYEGAKGDVLRGATERYSGVLGDIDEATFQSLLKALGGR
jgi:hypothetical protein